MLGDELIELHAHPRLLAPFSDRHPELDAQAGYAAAECLHEHRAAQGWRTVGRKIGFTNRTLWPRYGVYEPIWGRVYDRTLTMAANGRAEVALEGLMQPRIEPEVCFCLHAAPPPTKDPGRLLACVAWVAHAIEIVQCPHPGWKMQLADCTAFNGLHGRLVVGPPIPVAGLPELSRLLPALEVTLLEGNRVVDKGRGENVLGSPLLALAHLVEILASQPRAALAAGEIISTGTLTDAHPVAPGETWRTRFSGGLPLAGMEIRFR